MHAKLVTLLFLIPNFVLSEIAANFSAKKRIGTNEDSKLGHRPIIRYGNESQVLSIDGRDLQRRFTNGAGSNGLKSVRKVVAPVAGIKATKESSFFDYFNEEEDDGKEEEEEDDDDDDDEEEDEKEEEYEDEDEENDSGDKKKKKKPPHLRGSRRKYVRAHKIIFPLLLAYKLKFFAMLPLLVGSLVLLIGTTGIAGFFFALFSAALGLHVKARH